MNSRTFGGVLENLLYISKQKKSSLASYLGYDVSYINKWINSKNLPSVKRAAEICDNISKFIIESLDDDSKKHLIEYFELDNDGNDFLYEYIKDTLQEIYFEDSNNKGNQNIPMTSVSQEYYNTNCEMRPTLLSKTIREEIEYNVNAGNDLDIIISVNIFSIDHKDKIALANMKKYFNELRKKTNVKINFLLGFDGENKDEILNSLLTINILSLIYL